MDLNTAAMTGLKLVGYERPLPIWEMGIRPEASPSGNGKKHRKETVAG
jgi:hypothetical protein